MYFQHVAKGFLKKNLMNFINFNKSQQNHIINNKFSIKKCFNNMLLKIFKVKINKRKLNSFFKSVMI